MTDISLYIAIISWGSFFVLSWLIILQDRFQNGTAILFWVFFLIIAFSATVAQSGEKKEEKKEEEKEEPR